MFSSLASRSVAMMQSNDAYLIDNIDESLSFFASKVSRESDTEWGVYEGPNDRDELGCGGIRGGGC